MTGMTGIGALGTGAVELAVLLPAWAWPAPGPGGAAPATTTSNSTTSNSTESNSTESAAPPGPLSAGPSVRLVGPISVALDRSGAARGPLAGLRLAAKENVAVAGLPLRAGAAARDGVAPEATDAPIVAALLAAGARLVGTTRMHELAFGVTGLNAGAGTVAHPVDPGRIPGGSSSGSAVAVATDLADVALATDTGGSARIPAALVGVVGFKASRALPVDGVLPLAPTLDHLGWCTRDVATAVRVAAALGLTGDAGPAAGATKPGATKPGAAGRPPRLGVLAAARDVAEPGVRAPFDRAVAAAAAAGAELVVLDWPHLDLVTAVTTTIMFAEAALEFGGPDLPYGPDVADRLRQGMTVSARAYLAARRLGDRLSSRFDALTAGLAGVIAPTTGITAPPFDAVTRPGVGPALLRVTRLDDLTGRPALSLPLPGPAGRLPVGLHVTGHTDGELLATAGWLERVVA